MNIYKVEVIKRTTNGSVFTWRHFVEAGSYHVAFARAARPHKSVTNKRITIMVQLHRQKVTKEQSKEFWGKTWTAGGAGDEGDMRAASDAIFKAQ